MDIGTLSLLLLIGIFVLLSIGVPLGFATGLLGAIIIFSNFGMPGLGLVMQRVYDLSITYSIIAVPLFIVMASLLERSGIAKDMYNSLNIALGRMRGGVAIVTTVMAVIMAAMSGIIGGEIVLLGLVALPQMLRLGYNKHLAIGTICAGGSLGTMIPPSVVLIIFGLITETSITALFTAAFIPGLMLAASYIGYIIVVTRLKPELAPTPGEVDGEADTELTVSLNVRSELAYCLFPVLVGLIAVAVAGFLGADSVGQVASFIFSSSAAGLMLVFVLKSDTAHPIAKGLLPPLIVVDLVLGSIYGGVTGITEAAAMGVVSTFILISIRKELGLDMLLESLEQTFRSVGTILWVTFGATVLAGAYSLSGGNTYVANLIFGLDIAPIGVILIMMVIFLILGMFMDWIGIVLLTMPVFMPIVLKLGYDPVWFGILFSVNMQVAFLTPPFGSAAFYLKSVTPPEIDLITIYRSFGPFICLQLAVLALLLIFPEISLFLIR
ncbi:MAG: TRAP transporter large permease subunit [Rhodobacteraceae bacterium]|nr:TRAP transporter large permease subunit [Paracoccaceae bacterium]